MSFEIQALATATPQHGIDQVGAAEFATTICCETEQQRRLLAGLYRRAGVAYRHSVLLESPTPPLAATEEPAVDSRAVHDGAVSTAATPQAVPRTRAQQSFFEPASDSEDCGPTTTQRMAAYERHAASLAHRAADLALQRSPYAAEEITHLITVSCTGFAAPGVDLSLIRSCGLRPDVARTHVGFMGCHGALNGLRVAKGYADSDSDARVLLCAVELCTLHHQYGWHPDRIVSNSLFADGAAAVVGAGSPAKSHWRVTSSGSTVVPGTEEAMTWNVRDHGFEMTLSPQVPDAIRDELKPWLTRWLGARGHSLESIGSWAVHPGGPRILRACEEALDFHDDQLRESRQVLADYGNMSSPTVLFILERLLERSSPLPCVMLAFGPGLTVEAALIE
ncbi:MAG: type III polyketide synthase [Planctomycetales bacterium]|nr:type III polyketide synthase [Planctomycetales bacterium]